MRMTHRRITALVLTVCLMLLCCLSASAESTGGETLEEVNLIVYAFGNGINEEQNNAVAKKISEYCKEKINATVEIRFSYGDYSAQMTALDGSGEPYDICWASSWLNIYNTNAMNGAYYAIEDLLPVYTPRLYNEVIRPSAMWDSMLINGHIYGVPIKLNSARERAYYVPTEYAEKYNFDVTTVETLSDFHDYLVAIKADLGKVPPFSVGPTRYITIQYVDLYDGASCVGYDRHDDPSDGVEIINIWDTDRARDYIKTMREFAQEGLVRPYGMAEGDFTEFSAVLFGSYSPGAEKTILTNSFPLTMYDSVEVKPTGIGLISTGSMQQAINCISANSANPERALMFLELVNTDEYLYNLMVYGVEGVNYVKEADGSVTRDDSNPYGWAGYGVGSFELAYVTSVNPDFTLKEKTAEWMNNAEVAPLMGFVPDGTKISVELSNLYSIVAEYLTGDGNGNGIFMHGQVDFETGYAEFMAKLEAAGIQKVIDELQTQVDAFLAAKK